MKLNKLTSSVLMIGQRLKIPTNISDDDSIYVVKSGDTLWNIAKKYNISLDELLKINNLTKDSILNIGQKIKIPNETIPDNNYIIYTVKSGDSLWDIARKYNTTVDEIMNSNNLKSNLLQIGQQLKIPNYKNDENQTIYIVKSGDSLWSIAKKYNTTVDELKRKNKLNSNNLKIGQQLII